MDQIKLLYSADKAGVARQLQSALGEAGYRVGLEEVQASEGGAIAGRTRGFAAALLIWSRELAASAVLDGWLAGLRSLPNLIELSADGFAPQEGDESRIVLLSGWRGQPFHQGWQRLLAELGSLGEAPSPAPVPAPAAAESDRPASPQPPANGQTPPRPQRRGRLSRFALAALGAVIVVAGIGGLVLRSAGSGRVDRPIEVTSTGQAPAPRAAPVESIAAAPQAMPSEALPQDIPSTPPGAGSATASPSSSLPAPLASPGPELRRAGAGHSARPRGPIPIKRYSRRNSRTMRLFCARAGRHTPQCRIFRHSTGG